MKAVPIIPPSSKTLILPKNSKRFSREVSPKPKKTAPLIKPSKGAALGKEMSQLKKRIVSLFKHYKTLRTSLKESDRKIEILEADIAQMWVAMGSLSDELRKLEKRQLPHNPAKL